MSWFYSSILQDEGSLSRVLAYWTHKQKSLHEFIFKIILHPDKKPVSYVS